MKEGPERRRGQQGAVLVEVAVTIMLFLIFILAIWEAGRFLNFQETLTSAAREGARLSAVPLTQTSTLPTDAAIEDRVKVFLRAAGVNDSTATINITRPVVVNTGAVDTEFTKVEVIAPYQILTIPMFSFLQANLSGEAQMRNETSP